jgi:hypothetical protein
LQFRDTVSPHQHEQHMEAVHTSKTSTYFQNIWRYVPDVCHLWIKINFVAFEYKWFLMWQCFF